DPWGATRCRGGGRRVRGRGTAGPAGARLGGRRAVRRGRGARRRTAPPVARGAAAGRGRRAAVGGYRRGARRRVAVPAVPGGRGTPGVAGCRRNRPQLAAGRPRRGG